MHLLLFEWNALMQRDLETVLHSLHITFYRLSYNFSNIHEDDFFCARFENHLKCHHYDAVISFNFFPLTASVCYKHHIKYISWCYDSPVRVLPYDTFRFPTNFIFMFDKKEAAFYRSLGFDNVYHMPLAVNVSRMKRLKSAIGLKSAICDLSFIGNFHSSNFLDFIAPLPAYYRGYLNALTKAQQNLWTYYLPDDFFHPAFMDTLNSYYKQYMSDPDYSISREDFSFLFGKYITETERISYLSVLSKFFNMNLYSNNCPEQLTHINHMGTADYYTDMSRIFALSKINFNLSFYCIRSGISLRILDILAAGGFLLTNYQEEFPDYFDPDNDFVLYTDVKDAVEKTAFYLKHDELREKISSSGQKRTWETFSYETQLKKIFTTAGLIN